MIINEKDVCYAILPVSVAYSVDLLFHNVVWRIPLYEPNIAWADICNSSQLATSHVIFTFNQELVYLPGHYTKNEEILNGKLHFFVQWERLALNLGLKLRTIFTA